MPAGIAAPTVQMTPYEIYNEFLWTSAETEMGAFAMTAKFMAVNLSTAFLIGWHVGGHFYHFAESVDPNYGYDLTTMYGDYNLDFGAITGETSGRGYLNDEEIQVINEWCENAEPC